MVRTMATKVAVGLAVAALTAACAAPGPMQYETGRAHITPDGLHQVKAHGGSRTLLFVRPGTDLTKYQQLLLEPVRIRYKPGAGRHLDARKTALLEKYFREELEKELGASEIYTLTTQPGPGVLSTLR